MSVRLRDLIRSIRQAKTAAEERAIIAKECAAIRTALKDDDNPYRARNMAKLIYIQMLGHSVDFGKIAAISLVTSESFPEKRMGYLSVTMMVEETDPVLTLMENTIQKDLMESTNQFVQGLGLLAIANIANEAMIQDLLPLVLRLMSHAQPYIRKKACLAACRAVQKVPDLCEMIMEKLPQLLSDKNYGVIVGAVQLAIEVATAYPESIVLLQNCCIGPLVKLMRTLLSSSSFSSLPGSQGSFGGRTIGHGASSNHRDVVAPGVLDPFVQVKILHLFRLMLLVPSQETTDTVSEIFAAVGTHIDIGRNAENSVLYECARAVINSEDLAQPLRVLAINILGRFLTHHRDNNLRYVALSSLRQVVGTDPAAVMRHRATIVDCLTDPDVSIQRRAADLMYMLASKSNVELLTRELTASFLEQTTDELREDFTPKVCSIISQYAPSALWHIDAVFEVLRVAGKFVPASHIVTFISVISQHERLQPYVVHKMFAMLELCSIQPVQPRLLEVAVWCVGEYGDLLLQEMDDPAQRPDVRKERARSEAEVVDALEIVVLAPPSRRLQLYALTALAKLAQRFHALDIQQRISGMLQPFGKSIALELQTRAAEFLLAVQRGGALKDIVFGRMPALQRQNISRKDSMSTIGSPVGTGDRAVPAAGVASSAADGSAAAAAAGSSGKNGGVMDELDMLLGGSSSSAVGSFGMPGTAVSKAAMPLLDELLLGPTSVSGAARAPAPVAAVSLMSVHESQGATANLDDLLSGGPVPPPDALSARKPVVSGTSDTSRAISAPAPVPPEIPPQVVFDKHGLSVTFEFKKHPANPGMSAIRCIFKNSSDQAITNFSFQAAVPKYLLLELKPASAKVVPAAGAGRLLQEMRLTNTQHGQKPVMLRIKLEWDWERQGGHVVEQAELKDFRFLDS